MKIEGSYHGHADPLLVSIGDAALRALGDAPLSETARTAARAAVLGARGNSGMMLAHFLLGFAETIGERDTAKVSVIAAAVRNGADTLERSLDEPREGTILTVARDAATPPSARSRLTRHRRVRAPGSTQADTVLAYTAGTAGGAEEPASSTLAVRVSFG